jgi:hypothetical protein
MSIKKIMKHGKKHCPTCTCAGNSPGKGEIGGHGGAIGGMGGAGGGK